MSAVVVFYKTILQYATIEQLLSLCEPRLRELLSAEAEHEYLLIEDQRLGVLKGAVDISFACKDKAGKEVLLDLVRAKAQGAFINKLASYAQLDGKEESSVLQHYKSNPVLLEKFLGWKQDESNLNGDIKAISGVVNPNIGLRYYQLMGVRQILKTLEEKKRCLYQAPTGAGKTRTAMEVVARHFLAHGPTKILWLASTTELVDQACNAFEQVWKYKGDTDAVLYSWRGGGASFNPSGATNKDTMLVASVQLLTSRDREISELKGAVSLIVFDEAHQSLAPKYKDILIRLLDDENCQLLGLSATPIRTESDEASNALAEMFFKNCIRIHTVGRNPIEFLVSEGFLAQAQFRKFDFLLKNMPRPKSSEDDYSPKLLEWLGLSLERNHAIVNYVRDAIDQGRKRILVFTPSVLSARYCALILRFQHGIDFSYCISGEMNKQLRSRNLAKFKSKESEPVVLFNCQVLTTGFDAPETDAVVVARPTKSATLYAQMIGRALRGPKSGGTITAFIYNFSDQQLKDYNDLVLLFEAFERSWS